MAWTGEMSHLNERVCPFQVDQGFQAHFKVISKLADAIAPFSVTFGGSQVITKP